MKNVHVIPTDKPSRLHLGNSGLVLCDLYYSSNTINSQHVYITNSEEIKEDVKWIIHNGKIHEVIENKELYISVKELNHIDIRKDLCKKIILTTDQDLIKDGVQAIDDTFLEWFIKNPSCEFVEVIPLRKSSGWYDEKEVWHWDFLAYKIIIQKEEPKQETLEEAAKRLFSYEYGEETYVTDKKRDAFIEGAEWQQERMYSEEEVIKLWNWLNDGYSIRKSLPTTEELIGWFEQFKKK